MTNKVETIAGKGMPLIGNDIDTDRIIPARFLRCVTFDGLGENAFADDRTQQQGQHPFDLPQYQGANILAVNGNFGCGSSREHAPQALSRWGIQALIGESFAEIFFGNCLAMGIPCLTATAETIEKLQQLLSQNPDLSLVVDLTTLQVTCGEFTAPVSLSEEAQQMLVTGTWDTCSQLLGNLESIESAASGLPYSSWFPRSST